MLENIVSAHRDCNINVKSNHKIPIEFHNLKNYNSRLIIQELGKANFKINVILNGLENYVNFNINNKLVFINSFQFLLSLLDSLVKNLGKNDFKYLNREFDSKILDLIKQKGFYPYEYTRDFEKLKEELPNKGKFYSSLTGKKTCDKEYEHVLTVWNKFEMKKMKDYHDLYLKCDALLLADVFEKFRNYSFKSSGLCSSHFLNAPALSWDAMLNMTKV